MSAQRVFGVEKFKGLLLAGSFSTVVEYLLGLSDSIVAGHLIGENALAAINLVQPVMTGVTFFAGLCGVGMGINYAYESGRCAPRRAHEFFTQAFWTVLFGGALLAAGTFALRGPFLSFMDPGPEIARHAADYWAFYWPSALLEPIVILLVNAAMADGDSRLCFATYFAQLFVNFTVSLLASRTALGAGGCSFGTLVANCTACALLLCHFRRKSNTFRLVRHFAPADTLRIWKSSFGDSSSYLCSAGLFFFLGKYVVVNYGGSWLPVLSAVIVTIGFLEFFNGVGIALAPIATVYVAERNTCAVRTVMRAAQRWAVGEGLVLTAALLAFPGLVTGTLGLADPRLLSAANAAVRLVSGGLTFYSLVYLYNSYYVFVGREAMAVAVTVLNGLLLPIALVCALGPFGPRAAWGALALAPAAAMAGFAVYVVVRHGASKFPLLLDSSRDAKISVFDLELEDRAIVEASAAVARVLEAAGVASEKRLRAALMTEEVFMAVKDRNAGRRVLAEATLDLNAPEGAAADGAFTLTLRDDGEIFDITDADQKISSLRTFLVASVMERQTGRMNLVTTGFNRNVFRF